jgi:hypothetical protein
MSGVARTAGIGGPVPVGWREGTLTRAAELKTLCAWVFTTSQDPSSVEIVGPAINTHLDAAREAATAAKLNPQKRLRLLRNASLLERAMSNLDAAEAELLNVERAEYVLGHEECRQNRRCLSRQNRDRDARSRLRSAA